MTEEILISLSSQETRVAVVEQGLLQEILIERTHTRGVLGNIYKGRVTRVMPGMQSAFIDVGLPRAAFVHVSDILDTHPLISSDERSVGLRSATDVPTI
ncbi:MAG: S1 RNA-binding domain-containing protein, partial [Pseudomonadales bacterium]|nr:S1 RNA-binding domain-containing protein [Pseudomonadales bacterium]